MPTLHPQKQLWIQGKALPKAGRKSAWLFHAPNRLWYKHGMSATARIGRIWKPKKIGEAKNAQPGNKKRWAICDDVACAILVRFSHRRPPQQKTLQSEVARNMGVDHCTWCNSQASRFCIQLTIWKPHDKLFWFLPTCSWISHAPGPYSHILYAIPPQRTWQQLERE